MITPAIGKKSEELTPEEREERYGTRSLADLRRDMNAVFTWKADVFKDKNRQDSEILALQGVFLWALSLSLVSIFGFLGILAWAVWG